MSMFSFGVYLLGCCFYLKHELLYYILHTGFFKLYYFVGIHTYIYIYIYRI